MNSTKGANYFGPLLAAKVHDTLDLNILWEDMEITLVRLGYVLIR